MPFASKSQAVDSNGNIKKGYREITDKNGKTKYLSENKPKAIPKSDKKEPKKESKVKKESKAKKEPKKKKGKEEMEIDETQFIVEGFEI
jgi:hypothetical protein